MTDKSPKACPWCNLFTVEEKPYFYRLVWLPSHDGLHLHLKREKVTPKKCNHCGTEWEALETRN